MIEHEGIAVAGVGELDRPPYIRGRNREAVRIEDRAWDVLRPTDVETLAPQRRRRARLDWASELRSDALLVPFFGRAELRDAADVDRAAGALRPLCTRAAERGVSLLYEGALTSDGIRALAARVDSPAFGCYFDTANVVTRAMDTATELRGLGDLVKRVHVKDVHAKVGDCPPGLGRVDFAATSASASRAGGP